MGKLIVFDGNDSSGKKTQAEMLRDYLLGLGKQVLFLSFPRYDDTFFGKMLRKAKEGEYGNFADADPHFATVVYAADRWKTISLMGHTLDLGGYVVCDRYASANQIHQGGKFGDESERVEFLEWLGQMEYFEFGIPVADLTFYLDVPLEVSIELLRTKNRDTLENNIQYLRNSHQAAQWLISRAPEKWVHVRCVSDGQLRSREDIHQEVVFQYQNRFGF